MMPVNQAERVRLSILEMVAQGWNQERINYAVVHGFEGDPNTIGRDLDVIVDRKDVEQAIAIAVGALKRYEWIPVIHRKPWAVWITAFYFVNSESYSVEIDILSQLRWGFSILVSETSADRCWRSGVFRIDGWGSFVKRILIQVLGGNIDRIRAKPEELRILRRELPQVSSRLRKLLGSRLAEELMNAIHMKDIEWIRDNTNLLRRAVLLNTLAREPWKGLMAMLTWIRDEWAERVASPSAAPVVAVVGPDGVGKSSLLRALKLEIAGSLTFAGIQLRHWRPGFIPPLRTLLPLGALGSGMSESLTPQRHSGGFHWIRMVYYFIDFLLGYILKDRVMSSRLVLTLYDRCALDMLVDPLRYGLASHRGTRWLWRLIPKPDLVILLYDDPERIHARKPELPVKEIDEQIRKWLRLAEEGEVDAIIRMDSTLEEIAHRVKGLVIESFIEKNGGPISEERNPIKWLHEILANGTNNSSIHVGNRFRRKEKTNGSNHAYEFGCLTLEDGRGYLLPLHSGNAAVKGLDIYAAQRKRARIMKHALRIGLRLSIARSLLPKVHLSIPNNGVGKSVNDTLLTEHLKGVFGRHDLSFAISLGTPGPHRKPVIQVLKDKGETLAYVKVGWNDATNTLVQHEAGVLEQLAKVSFDSFATPRVLYAGLWNGRYLCAQSVMEGKLRSAPNEMTSEYLEVLRELATFNARWIPLRESNFWKDLLARIERLSNPYYRHTLEQGVYNVEACLGDNALRFYLCHGDFAPWNAKKADGRLFLFDWEYTRMEGPPGWDMFHFLIQTQGLLGKRDPNQIYSSLLNDGSSYYSNLRNYLGALKLDEKQSGIFLSIYLLDRISFYASIDHYNAAVLRRLCALINLLEISKADFA